MEDTALREVVERFETALDPARPTAGGDAEVVGYGEVSTVLRLAALPSWVCKRMAGFHDPPAASRYLTVVRRYLECLASHDIDVAETRMVAVRIAARRPVVYLLQPDFDRRGFGSEILRAGDDAQLLACVDRVLAHVRTLMLANRRTTDGRTLTVDAQLSNWHFPLAGGAVGAPRLVDVGTPFMRLHGIDEIGIELFLAPVPPPFRALSRWQRDVERYIDDYFDPRRILLDLLGNFHKETRPDRIPLVRTHVNRWLAAEGAALEVGALDAREIDDYYRGDARKLEFFLKVRRLDRYVRVHLLRQRYDFILPGLIRR